jgi:hypothetical protein
LGTSRRFVSAKWQKDGFNLSGDGLFSAAALRISGVMPRG